MPQLNLVLRHRDIPGLHELAVYQTNGGYAQLRRAVTELTPEAVIDIVKASGLRGRGGAGFPTGLKWSFVPKGPGQKYIVVNNDESEPGTFKDHEIMLRNPHQLIEGAAIAAYAVGASAVYIYSRGEFWKSAQSFDRAIAEARAAGLLGQRLFGTDYNLEVYTSLGAGAYICGEETALLSSLEGDLGQPRLKPPFPAVAGLYARPTVVNNTETLANVPLILERGADWYKGIGTEKSPGTKVCCVSGHVERPGNYEIPLGTPFKELLAMAGGVWKGRRLKAMMPAGASSPATPGEQCMDLLLDWESMAAAGSTLGSASFIIMDETTDMVWVAMKTSQFFKHESCGKCSPCREGTFWLTKVYGRLNAGSGTSEDVALVGEIIEQIRDKCFCPLGEFALSAPRSTMAKFPEDYRRAVGTVENGAQQDG
ncbi:MAG: NADH-quinone oxidoreductase subunit NuoF [Anaerolineae bacterium]|nr:NADH-quinone oxidoreductase subunit NuoF [Anaerolineae bacterium]